jgi:signal transduction histidine kinase
MHNLIHYKDAQGKKLPVSKCHHYNVALKIGKLFRSSDEVFWTKKDKPLHVELISNPIIDHGKTIGTVTSVTDITERKRLEELKTEFLSIVGHELRTPITTLLLIAQVLQKGKIYPKNKKSIDTISYELTRLNSLISDLLDTSRLDTNKFRISPQEIDLSQFIENSLDKLRMVITKHKLFVKKMVKVKIAADPHRLEQVMINLVSNAAKYSHPGSTITISAESKGKKVIVAISDQGIGIPKKNFERIFDKYYQIQHQTTSNGFGLGLYITREIIRKHKGKIWVESQEGKGSTFYFTLPIIV